MKLEEFYNEKNSIERLVKVIHFDTKPKETRLIQQRLRKKGINPTITQIKRHLLQHLLTPIEEIPEPERTVILRYQNDETQQTNQPDKTGSNKQKKASEHVNKR
ncbi:MAG: hypothetical protein GQ529_01895 [Methyloprofundus sp.]|nr:hypothetical protein [Methyloprofundus sp.]